MEPEPSSPLTPTVAPVLPVNIYCSNLPVSWSEDVFRSHFSSFGAIESAKILTDSSLKRSRGVGFLQFAQHQDALAAIAAMNGKVANDEGIVPQQSEQAEQGEQPAVKALVVKFATPKAANLNGATTLKAAKLLNQNQSPRTPRKHLTIPSSPTASSSSSTSSSASSSASSASSADHNLYIAGFPQSYTRDDVSRLLAPFGPLASLRLLPPSPFAGMGSERKGDRRGGVAFARFVCIEDGDRCIAAMDGQPIEGGSRGLQVRYANRGGRMNAQMASMAALDNGANSAVDYSAYASFYNLSSPYAPYDYSSQLLLSPTYGYSAAADLLSPTYASYPYSVADPYGAGSFFYPMSAAVSPAAGPGPNPATAASPAAYGTFSFPSPTTASIPYPTTPPHSAHATNSLNHSHSPQSANSSLFPSHLSLFLCHLPLHWSEANLLSLCQPFGHLTSARIVRDPHGGSRGYGFVAFSRAVDAARARDALDGRKVDGRLIKAQWKDGRASRPGGSTADGEGGGVEGGVHGGLLSPTSAAVMGLAVVA